MGADGHCMRMLVALPGGPRSQSDASARAADDPRNRPTRDDGEQVGPKRTESQLNLVVPAPATPAVQSTDYSDQDLDGVDFCGAQLQGARFCGASLKGARFVGAHLDDADFFGADLTGANLARAQAPRANFGGAQLDDVDAPALSAPDAVFTRATLQGANLQNATLTRSRFQHCDLTRATFHSADITEADFTACVLNQANFEHAQLDDAIFRNIHRYGGADFYGCDLSVANCTGSALFKRHASDENFIRELKERSTLSRVWVFIWWLTSDCGRSLSRWGAWTAAIAVAFAFAYTQVGVDFGANKTALSPLYFSIVTLTSLGYGDVLPTTVAGQAVAMAESLVGFCAIGGLITIFSNKVARRAD